jgi:GWxTD domain-containing protein
LPGQKSSLLRLITLLIPVFLLTVGCNPALKITGLDISSLYTGKSENSLKARQIYHLSDSLSVITTEIPSGLILPDPFTRKIRETGTLHYEVIGGGERIALTDSATFSIADTLPGKGLIMHTWTFTAPAGKDYFVKATYSVPGIADRLLLLESFSKISHECQSWYRFQNTDGEFIRGNRTSYPQPLRLVTTDTSNRTLTVLAYFREFGTPPPPFTDEVRPRFNYTPDSTFELRIANGISDYFTPNRQGMYCFSANAGSPKGPSFYFCTAGFPKVTQHSQMREALRYLTSAKEFQQLKAYSIPKVAVDSFWIANAGRPDLATELIRKYYSRVETANELYSSFTEGWKTDRGMIYILFGKPASVFRSFEQEIWIYGEYDDSRAIRFYFDKAVNPFSENDYVLRRNAYYKSAWYQSVQLWRR